MKCGCLIQVSIQMNLVKQPLLLISFMTPEEIMETHLSEFHKLSPCQKGQHNRKKINVVCCRLAYAY